MQTKFNTTDLKLLAIIPLAFLALQLIVTAANVRPLDHSNVNRQPAVVAQR